MNQTERESALRINALKANILKSLRITDANELEMILALTDISRVIIAGEVNGINKKTK